MAELTLDQKRALAVAEARRRAAQAMASPSGGSMALPQNMPAPSADNYSMGDQAMTDLTFGLNQKLNAAGMGAIDATIGAVKGEGFNLSDNYNRYLNWQRENQRLYNEQNPVKSAIGTGAGVALAIPTLPVIGTGLRGAASTGAMYGTVAGAGADADSLTERAGNAATGALTGGFIGGAGYGAGKAIGAGVNKGSRAWQALNADPQTRAALEIRGLATDAGGPDAIRRALTELGPDATLADVLGERGRAVGRNVSNISPEARETIESALLGRKAGQNQRVVADIEQAAGLPVGSTKTVDDLVEDTYQKLKPGVDEAYKAARAAGKDMPLQFFDDVLGTSQGQQVFKEAEAAVKARARLAGTPDNISNLAIIDEMKKIFEGKATSAAAQPDRAAASLWSDFAKSVRTRADAVMDMAETPVYSAARDAGRYSAKAQEAVKFGGDLGGSRVPLNLPGKVDEVELGNRQRLAQGYAAKKAETLLNRGSTEGALGELSTPQGKRAAEAALGPGALEKTLSREKTFNQTVKALTGNSTTARQLVEMGLGTGAATMLLTGDPLSGGVAGVLGALTRKGAPMIARKLTTDAQKKAAPLIADALLGRKIPAQAQSLAPGVLERLSGADRDKLTKILLLLTEQGQRQPPQPAAAR